MSTPFTVRRKFSDVDLDGKPIPNSYWPNDLPDRAPAWEQDRIDALVVGGYYPPNVELFYWKFPDAALPEEQLVVAYDALLPKGAVIVVHPARPELTADFMRWAAHVDDGADGGVSHFDWARATGEASTSFGVDNGGFQTIVVPARVPVYIAAWMPLYRHEELVPVTQ